MWLSKPRSHTNWNSFYSLSLYIATLHIYASSHPPLANVNWLAFQSAFCRYCKFMICEIVQWQAINQLWECNIVPTASACLSSRILAHYGYMWPSWLLWTRLFVLSRFFFLPVTTTQPTSTLLTHPHISVSQNLMHSLKQNTKKWQKQPLSICL